MGRLAGDTNHFSLGQVFRFNVDSRSSLNVNGVRTGTTRSCPAVTAHGGTVVEFNGDGMMAVFGAPDPLPEKERRAVDAARQIVEIAAQRLEVLLNRERLGVLDRRLRQRGSRRIQQLSVARRVQPVGP